MTFFCPILFTQSPRLLLTLRHIAFASIRAQKRRPSTLCVCAFRSNSNYFTSNLGSCLTFFACASHNTVRRMNGRKHETYWHCLIMKTTRTFSVPSVAEHLARHIRVSCRMHNRVHCARATSFAENWENGESSEYECHVILRLRNIRDPDRLRR